MKRFFLVGAAVLAVLCPLAPAKDKVKPAEVKPIKALLVLGGCCHDYAKQKDILTKGISARANVEVTIAYDPDTTTKHLNPVYNNPDWAKGYDVVIHDECSADVKDMAIVERILQAAQGRVCRAWCCTAGCTATAPRAGPRVVTPWFEFTGLQTTGHGAQLPIDVSFVDKESPITKGMADWTTINEELYNNIAGKVLDTAHPLARGKQGKDDNVCRVDQMYNKKHARLRHDARPQQRDRGRRPLSRSGDARPAVGDGSSDRRRQAGGGI